MCRGNHRQPDEDLAADPWRHPQLQTAGYQLGLQTSARQCQSAKNITVNATSFFKTYTGNTIKYIGYQNRKKFWKAGM